MTEQADMPVQADEDPAAKAARLRSEAAEIEASLPAPDGTVHVRVEGPHNGFGFGAAWVGRTWTPVARPLVQGLFQSAAEAGVTLTQKG